MCLKFTVYIQGHAKLGHKLFPFYFHTTELFALEVQPWARILQNDIEMITQNEINGLRTYFETHTVFSGLIFSEFEYEVNK